MKRLNQCKTKDEVLEWMSEKKRLLDKEVKLFLEQIHQELKVIEEEAREKLKELNI